MNRYAMHGIGKGWVLGEKNIPWTVKSHGRSVRVDLRPDPRGARGF